MHKLPVSLADIYSARERITATLPPTALTYSAGLSEIVGRELFCKWDNQHSTGSFKERGALNFLNALGKEARERGVCAASAGNHALALSFHAARAKIPCTIVMPTSAPLVKVQRTTRTGARVVQQGSIFDEAYDAAREISANTGMSFVSGFDDPMIIAGQGTCGLEILEQSERIDAIVVPCGGGGLISGIGIALKSLAPNIAIIGVQSKWVLQQRAANPGLNLGPLRPLSIADGIAVKKIGVINQPIIARTVDHLITVDEGEIADAIMHYLEVEHTVIEGAGAAALAAVLSNQIPEKYRRIVLLACGSNIDLSVLSRLIERDLGQRGRILRFAVSVPDRPGSLNAATAIVASVGANVLGVNHDRSFSKIPGNVSISFILEARSREHCGEMTRQLLASGLAIEIRTGPD